MLKWITVFACLFCFAACANLETQVAPIASATHDITATVTTTATYTPTITVTPAPSKTSNPTATSTPVLPAILPTSFPYPALAIDETNVASVRELAKFGTPHKLIHAISADGKRGFLLTSVGITGYETETGKVIGQYPAIQCLDRILSCMQSLSLSSNGNRFSIISLSTIQVWDLALGLILEIPRTTINQTAALSPTGKMLVLGNGDVTAISVDTGENFDIQPDVYGSKLLFSPDGSMLLVWQPGLSVSILEVATWKRVADHNLSTGQDFLAFSADGKLLASQSAQTLEIIEVDTWKLKRTFPIPNDKAHSTDEVQFSSDNQQITIRRSIFNVRTLSTRRLNEVYDIPTGKLLKSQEEAESAVLDTIPDRVCQAAGFSTAKDCNTNAQYFQSNLSYKDSTGQISKVNSIPYIDPPESNVCLVTPGLSQTCTEENYPVFFGQDDEPYSVIEDKTGQSVSIYPGIGTTSDPIGTIPLREDTIDPLWLSSDRRLFLVFSSTHISGFSFRSKIELWDLTASTRLKKWDVFRWYFSLVSQDEKYLVMNLTDYKVVYDLTTSRAITQINERTFNQSAFTHKGDRLVTVGDPESASPHSDPRQFRFTITDLNTLKISPGPLVVHNQYESGIEGIALSPDDRMLAIGMSDGAILIYSMETNELLHQWQAHFGNITQLVFSDDGRLLISNSQGSQNNGDGFVRVWGIWP